MKISQALRLKPNFKAVDQEKSLYKSSFCSATQSQRNVIQGHSQVSLQLKPNYIKKNSEQKNQPKSSKKYNCSTSVINLQTSNEKSKTQQSTQNIATTEGQSQRKQLLIQLNDQENYQYCYKNNKSQRQNNKVNQKKSRNQVVTTNNGTNQPSFSKTETCNNSIDNFSNFCILSTNKKNILQANDLNGFYQNRQDQSNNKPLFKQHLDSNQKETSMEKPIKSSCKENRIESSFKKLQKDSALEYSYKKKDEMNQTYQTKRSENHKMSFQQSFAETSNGEMVKVQQQQIKDQQDQIASLQAQLLKQNKIEQENQSLKTQLEGAKSEFQDISKSLNQQFLEQLEKINKSNQQQVDQQIKLFQEEISQMKQQFKKDKELLSQENKTLKKDLQQVIDLNQRLEEGISDYQTRLQSYEESIQSSSNLGRKALTRSEINVLKNITQKFEEI